MDDTQTSAKGSKVTAEGGMTDWLWCYLERSTGFRERGPWEAGETKEERSRAFIQSDDFSHDVRLYVDGDFADDEQRLAYAKEIARRLNLFAP
jgi:hypothetical protein